MAPLAVWREALCADGQSGSSVLACDTVLGKSKDEERKKLVYCSRTQCCTPWAPMNKSLLNTGTPKPASAWVISVLFCFLQYTR